MQEAGQGKELDGWLKEELRRIGSPKTAAAAKQRITLKDGSGVVASGAVITPQRPTNTGLPSPRGPNSDNKSGEHRGSTESYISLGMHTRPGEKGRAVHY